MNKKSVFGNFICNEKCKVKWVNGKGSFIGYRLKLCKEHQIIQEMKKL